MENSHKVSNKRACKENLTKRDEIITFLADNKTYPVLKNDKITFIKKRKSTFLNSTKKK